MNSDLNYRNLSEMMEDEDVFDLVELSRVLLRKLWLLILCMVIGAAGAGLITTQLITPKYEASSMIYIYSKSTSITSLADLQLGSQLAVDFQIVAKTRPVIENVISELELPMTYEDFLEHVEISNPSGSHVLKIVATSSDPVQAANISNGLANELRERIADVMNIDEPYVMDPAVVPEKPSSPSLKKNMVLGGLLCAVLAAAMVVVAYVLDDTIKTDQDVRKYLHLNTLAEIPLDRSRRNDTSEV